MGRHGDGPLTAQSSPEVSSVPPEQLAAVWPQVASLIARGCERGSRGRLSPDDILTRVASGDLILWVVHEDAEIIAAVVLRVVENAAGRALVIVLVTGADFDRWGDRIQELARDYAGLVGATRIEAVARPGMARWLKRMGWTPEATVMKLEAD